MTRQRRSLTDERPTAPPPSLDSTANRTTTQCASWQLVAGLLANVQRSVATIAEPARKRELEAELRPLARAVAKWQTVPPLPEQSASVLELLVQIQESLSDK